MSISKKLLQVKAPVIPVNAKYNEKITIKIWQKADYSIRIMHVAHLIVLSAVPGSGKSTWARRYVEENPNTHIVSSDEIRKKLFGKVNCFKNEPLVWETYLNDINAFAKEDPSCTVIADATNLQNKYRKYYHDETPIFEKHTLVVFNIPFETCLIQNKMRANERIVPESAMLKLKAEFEPVSDEVMDLYDEVIFIGKSFVSEALKNK